MRGRISKSAAPLRRQILFQTSLYFLRIGFYQVGGVPLIRQPAAATFPQGKAYVGHGVIAGAPTTTRGARLKRGNRGTVTPLLLSAAQGYDTNGTRLPIIGSKGVLRTIGSKRVFAEPQRGVSERNRAQRGSWRGDAHFSSARKVGRRRHNTYQYAVGYRQKDKALSEDKKTGPSRPKGQRKRGAP